MVGCGLFVLPAFVIYENCGHFVSFCLCHRPSEGIGKSEGFCEGMRCFAAACWVDRHIQLFLRPADRADGGNDSFYRQSSGMVFWGSYRRCSTPLRYCDPAATVPISIGTYPNLAGPLERSYRCGLPDHPVPVCVGVRRFIWPWLGAEPTKDIHPRSL